MDWIIQLYTFSGCPSCQKAKCWLEKNQTAFIEQDLKHQPIRANDLMQLLFLAQENEETIFSTRAILHYKFKGDLANFSLAELVFLLGQQPDLLRRPIITNQEIIQIGYNEENMLRFISE